MERSSVRLFVALTVVALPPLVAFAAINVFAEEWLAARGFGAGTQLLIGAAITVSWAAVVAVFAGRLMAGEARSLLELAERGGPGAALRAQELSDIQRRLAATLDERNQQIAALAEMVRNAPMEDDPTAVARSMAGVARRLTADPTWAIVVLRGPDEGSLPLGVYSADADGPPSAIEDVHRWATTLEPAAGETARGARHATGPWGGFVVVDLAAGDELRAILMAPWEGRPSPSPAELGLFSLLGQHAATAIEHALLYTRLRAQAEELSRMAAIQADFLRGVTHDLQTPLTSISALAAELRESVGSDNTAVADLDTITHQADRLRRMVGQLLVVSRLEAREVTPRQEVFRVEPIVRRTWEALRADRPFELVVDGSEHLAVGDPDRFEQVLWAILDNAVKYSPAGGGIAVRLTVADRPDTDGGPRAVLEVSDHGAGMDSETAERAFEQFFRSSDARRMAPDGSGIGLYAASGLMRAMGGHISMESRLGSGTTVRLSLPAELIESSPGPTAEESELIGQRDAHGA